MSSLHEDPHNFKQHARWRGQANGQSADYFPLFSAHIDKLSVHGDEVRGCCLFHPDHTPSWNGNRVTGLWKCHGCGAQGNASQFAERVGEKVSNGHQQRKIVATYDYTDEAGKLLYQSVRYEPKDFRQRRPDGNSGWIWNLNGTRRVLHRLPDIRQADIVYIVEGEKDDDRLVSLGLIATTPPQGAGKWLDEYNATLAGKHVVILPDNDDVGEQHALHVARSLLPVAASVKIVRLPDLPPKGDVSDWLDAGHTKEELLAIVEATPALQYESNGNGHVPPETDWSDAEENAHYTEQERPLDDDPPAPTWDGEAATQQKSPGAHTEAAWELPEIQINTDIKGMVDAAEEALLDLPGPGLYQRAKMICRIAPAGESPKWLQRPPDAPIIARADTPSLREYSGQSAQWVKYDKRAKEWSPALPPTLIFETLASRVAWKFPYLEGVICAPTLRPDGVLVSKPGYDKETGLYLDLNGVAFPPVPAAPTRDDAKVALDILHAPFADFPFKDECHRSAALASVLTIVGRYAIAGNVPAFAARAHSKGTGKGLLVNTIAMIGTGRTAPTWTQTLDEAEEAKRLLSIALAGDACMHIDNITKPFGSAKLDSALTSATVKDRLLGGNTNLEAPWLTVVFASGNNMTFVGDMVRRVVPIDLDPKVEHPEERSGFSHTPLLEWVKKERPRLVVAALTVLKAFFHAGCPKQPNVSEFGSFEQWSNLIRHSLIWAGFPDPCEGRRNLEEESDTSYEALATLLQCWADCYPDTQARTLKTITEDIERRRTPDPNALTPGNEWNALHDALSSYDAKYDGKRLDTKRIGNALRPIEGRVLDGQRLIRKGEDRNKVTLWKREIIT